MFLSDQGSMLWEHNAVNFVQVLVILDGIGLYTWIYPGTLVLGSIHLNKVLVCPTPSSTVAELFLSKSTSARDIILFSPLFSFLSLLRVISGFRFPRNLCLKRIRDFFSSYFAITRFYTAFLL